MDKKLKNELFMVAVDYLFREKLVDSQKDLADKIGITEPSLSRIKNGKKTVSDDTLRKMNESFGGIFDMRYFRGESRTLTLEDAAYYKAHPEDDMFSTNCENKNEPIDHSSLVNAALAAKDQVIAQMELRISEKDETIRTQRQLIQALQQQVADFRARYEIGNLEKYPFPVGSAEPGPNEHDRVNL